MAVNQDAGVYRTSYWGFGVEAIAAPTDREAAGSAFLQWCDVLATVDGDTDGTLNGDDCAPADSAVWAVPSAASDLRLGNLGELVWTAPALPGGSGVTYDVLRGDAPELLGFVGSCIASGLTVEQANDPSEPVVGAYFYLVRSRNVCGASLGSNSAGSRPGGDVCP